MPRQSNTKEKVAHLAAADAGPALAGEADSLALANTGRDAHLVSVGPFALAVIPAPAQRDLADRAAERLLESDHDVGLDVPALVGDIAPAPVRLAGRAELVAASSEE